MQKRGQIAIFMLLGLFLLGVLGIYAWYALSNTDSVRQAINYPEPKTPIETFVSSCMHTTAKDGLTLIGMQGGYYQLPAEFQANPQSTIANAPNSPIKTPLWYYNGVSYAPSREVVEQQLALYIEENIPNCLNGINQIQQQPINVSSPKVRVQINEVDVSVYLDYTIQEVRETRTTTTQEFAIGIPIKLAEIITTGEQVLNTLRQDTILEELTIDIMAAGDPLIPMTGIDFSCVRPVWSELQVKQNLQDLLYQHIPLLKVKEADHTPFQEDIDAYKPFAELPRLAFEKNNIPENKPSDQVLYNQYYIDANLGSSTKEKGINVAFRYLPTYGLDMNVRPNGDGILRAEQEEGASSFLGFFCMNVYHFTYDVTFPVEVVIIQENAFNDGSQFTLRFASPVYIDHNLPAEQTFFSSNSFGIDDQEGFCAQRSDKEVIVYARDNIHNQLISDVDITYECVRFSCPLGTTKSELNGIQRLTTTTPQGCYGGTLTLTKDGYVKSSRQLQADQDVIEIPMMPLVSVYYDIDLAKASAYVIENPLTSTQKAFVTIDNERFEKSFIYDSTKLNQLQVPERSDIYNISVIVYDGSKLIGGYVGEFIVEEQNLRQQLIFHVYEQIPHPTDAKTTGELMLYLDQGEYQDEYGPVWS